jgi:hypothetical protein
MVNTSRPTPSTSPDWCSNAYRARAGSAIERKNVEKVAAPDTTHRRHASKPLRFRKQTPRMNVTSAQPTALDARS